VDAETFRRFYADSAPSLRAYLRYRLNDPVIADDLLQETFLRVLRADPASLHQAQLRSYLFRAATSVIADHFRCEARSPDALAVAAGQRAEALRGATGCEPELPLDVARVLAQLGERDRELLWLAYVEGFSHREIGPIVGVEANSVRVLLLRARERMAQLLSDHGLGPEEAA
jgi:RNA polymerase sigma-70 factor (ECF subfamily)